MVYYSLLTVVRRQNCGAKFFHTKWQITGKIDIIYAIYRKKCINVFKIQKKGSKSAENITEIDT